MQALGGGRELARLGPRARLHPRDERMPRAGPQDSPAAGRRLVHPAGRLAQRALQLGGQAVAQAARPAARVGPAGEDVAQVGAAGAGAARQLGGGAGLGDQPPKVREADAVDLFGHGRRPLAQG